MDFNNLYSQKSNLKKRAYLSLGEEVHNVFIFVDEVTQKQIVTIYDQTDVPSIGEIIHLDISINPEMVFDAESVNQDYIVKSIKRRYKKYYPASAKFDEVTQGSETYIFVEAIDDK